MEPFSSLTTLFVNFQDEKCVTPQPKPNQCPLILTQTKTPFTPSSISLEDVCQKPRSYSFMSRDSQTSPVSITNEFGLPHSLIRSSSTMTPRVGKSDLHHPQEVIKKLKSIARKLLMFEVVIPNTPGFEQCSKLWAEVEKTLNVFFEVMTLNIEHLQEAEFNLDDPHQPLLKKSKSQKKHNFKTNCEATSSTNFSSSKISITMSSQPEIGRLRSFSLASPRLTHSPSIGPQLAASKIKKIAKELSKEKAPISSPQIEICYQLWQEAQGSLSAFFINGPTTTLKLIFPNFFLHLDGKLRLKESLKDFSLLPKKEIYRIAFLPILEQILIDFSQRLALKQNSKKIATLLQDLPKLSKNETYAKLYLYVAYRQFLLKLKKSLINHFSHEMSDLDQSTSPTSKIARTFRDRVTSSSEFEKSFNKTGICTRYCQEMVDLNQFIIEALDKKIVVEMAPFVQNYEGSAEQLRKKATKVLLTTADRQFENDLPRPIEGNYLTLTPNTSPLTNEINQKNLELILMYLHKALIGTDYESTGYEDWFSSEDVEDPFPNFQAKYKKLMKEWLQLISEDVVHSSELPLSTLNQLLKKNPSFKLPLVMGLFSQEFVKACSSKISEMYKHLIDQNKLPIRSNTSPKVRSNHFEFITEKKYLKFIATRIDQLQLNSDCKIETNIHFKIPKKNVANLSVEFEASIHLPDNLMNEDAAQQLTEILLIMKSMSLLIRCSHLDNPNVKEWHLAHFFKQ